MAVNELYPEMKENELKNCSDSDAAYSNIFLSDSLQFWDGEFHVENDEE